MKSSERINLALSISACVVSTIAVGVYSNNISKSAYELSVDTFNSERRIALRTVRKDNYIQFGPLESGQQIHDLTVFFPSELDIGVLAMTPPDLTIYDTRIDPEIKRYIESRISAKEGFAQVALNYTIPALILLHGYS